MSQHTDELTHIREAIQSIDRTLAVQAQQLTEHMRRTELAEKAIAQVNTDIQPIRRHVHHMEGALKFLGLLSVVVAIIAGVWKVFTTL